jgi:uncharacterized membrane protein
MLKEYLIVLILGLLPISETRGAILYGLGMGLNIPLVFLIGVGANILTVPIIFWVLKKGGFLNLAKKLFGKRVYAKIEKDRKKFERWEELALLLFVAIPAPFTGSWTGALVAVLLNMNKKKAFLVIALGVLIAGITTLAIGMGLIQGINLFAN